MVDFTSDAVLEKTMVFRGYWYYYGAQGDGLYMDAIIFDFGEQTRGFSSYAFVAYHFDADAVIVPLLFTADAWIVGERWRHHRVRDHFGIESDLYVVLSSDVGPYAAFTPLHWVMEDLVTRMAALENGNRVRGLYFVSDAWLAASGTYGLGLFSADAAIWRADMAGSFTADSLFTKGGTFAADAVLQAGFTANAFIL